MCSLRVEIADFCKAQNTSAVALRISGDHCLFLSQLISHITRGVPRGKSNWQFSGSQTQPRPHECEIYFEIKIKIETKIKIESTGRLLYSA